MTTAVLLGVAGAAAMVMGAFNMNKADEERKWKYSSMDKNEDTSYIYEDQGDERAQDPYEFKHSMYEDRHASPAWEDQQWQLDCSNKESCLGVRTPGDGVTPFGVPPPPMYGEVQDRTVRDIGTHEPGSFLDQIEGESDRDASTELELPPEHTVNYTCHPLDWGGQLTSDEIPYGASEATDLEYWGPENWDSYRYSKRPAYLDQATNYKDGKEINRPLDDFGPKWDESEGGQGAHQWGIGAGEFTARDAGPRLLARNLYGRHVTTREYDRPKFLPPTPGGAVGGGNPGLEAEVTFGERVNRLFSAFMPWKSAAAGTLAPPDFADQTLDKSRRLLYDPGLGVAAARGGQMSFGGPGVNPVQGGRIKQVNDELTLPKGNQGRGGSSFLLLGPYEEYRPRKMPSDLQDYVAPRGGSKTGTYGGEAANGIVFPNIKSESLETRLTISGRGGRGLLGKAGIITLGHNTSTRKEDDVDNSPYPAQEIDLRTPLAKAMQVEGRTQRSLDDLFDVQHS